MPKPTLSGTSIVLYSIWLAAFAFLPCGSSIAADARRPNIVFIFADDCGIDSFGCYGSDRFKGLSPNIDALASSGTRFDRCYSTPLCGPSRCVLMTGRYGFRTGGTSNQTASSPKFTDEPALARILGQAGYVTGMAGKWRQMSDSPGDWGFKEFITDPTAGGYFWQKSYTKNGEQITSEKEIYYPDVASDFAVDFFRRHRAEPFYFYLSEQWVTLRNTIQTKLPVRLADVTCTASKGNYSKAVRGFHSSPTGKAKPPPVQSAMI